MSNSSLRAQSYGRDVALEGVGVYRGRRVIPMGMAAVMGDTKGGVAAAGRLC